MRRYQPSRLPEHWRMIALRPGLHKERTPYSSAGRFFLNDVQLSILTVGPYSCVTGCSGKSTVKKLAPNANLSSGRLRFQAEQEFAGRRFTPTDSCQEGVFTD
jgi:hypothetical protein